MESVPKGFRYTFVAVVLVSMTTLLAWQIGESKTRSAWRSLLDLGIVVNQSPLDYKVHDFTLKDQLGRPIQLSKYDDDTLILVHFWATDCAPCVEEFPDLNRLADIMGRKLAILTIGRDKTRAVIDRFVVAMGGTNMLLLHDPEQKVMKRWGVTAVPETFVIKNDIILTRFVGKRSWTKGKTLQYLRFALEL